jgi:hypothetical protein
MEVRAKDKPLGVCSVCHALTDRHEYLNQRCRESFQGRRCYGTFKSGVSALWDRCEGCHGTGKVGTQRCGECAGFGWKLYA